MLLIASPGVHAASVKPRYPVRVPFQFYANEILFQARLNHSKPLWFILDTGCSDVSINERTARELGLSAAGQTDLGDSSIGEARVQAVVLKNISVQLGGLDLPITDHDTIAVPMKLIEAVLGRRIAGVLGAPIFEQFVVAIDYEAKVFTLYEPGNYRYRGKGDAVPLIVHEVPYMRAGLVLPDNSEANGIFMVDTGCADALNLTTPFSSRYNLPAKIKTTCENLGAGGGGLTHGRVGRIKEVVFHKYRLNNPLVSFSRDQKGGLARADIAGLIGNEILQRFQTIFDYSRNRLILEPAASFHRPMEWNMSGLFLYTVGANHGQIRVYDVIPGSPAALAGVKAGDLIDSIDGVKASRYTMAEVARMLKCNQKRYRFGIIRKGGSFEVKIKLKRQI